MGQALLPGVNSTLELRVQIEWWNPEYRTDLVQPSMQNVGLGRAAQGLFQLGALTTV